MTRPTRGPTPTLRLVTDGEAEPGDDALFVLAAAGRTEAFDALVRRHEARLRGHCRSLLGDAALADEAAQETFLKLWNARASYRPDGRFRELLFTIAGNTCRSMGRKAAVRAVFLNFFGHEPAVTDDAARSHEVSEREVAVRRAIATLPPKFREPLLLRFVEDLPYDEIARVIGRTPSAARSRIHYGLKALADALPAELAP